MSFKQAVALQMRKAGITNSNSETHWGNAAEIDESELKKISRSHLRRHLSTRGESSDGTKKQLIYRLQLSFEREKRQRNEAEIEQTAKFKQITELEEAGAVYSIGSNHKGQLGLGDLDHRGVFTVVSETRGIGVCDLALRNDTVFAVTENNFVYSWGGSGVGPMGLESNKKRSKFESPQLVEHLNGDGIISVSVGSNHACAVSDGGDVYVWGNGRCGCLGQGDVENSPTPNLLLTLSDKTIIQYTETGAMHNCALSQEGEVYCWGHSGFGRLGIGQPPRHGVGDKCGELILIPSMVMFPNRERVRMISCGSDHTIAVTDSKVFSWGSGDGFRLGHGDYKDRYEPTEIISLTGLSISDISCGTWHSACIAVIPPFDKYGWVYTWGSGFQGQLGQGDISISTKPTTVSYFVSNHVLAKKVICGSHHNAIITKEAELYTWGSNANGCLGHKIEENFVTFSPHPGYCAGFGAIVKRIGRGFPRSVVCGRGFTIVCTSQYCGPSEELADKLMTDHERREIERTKILEITKMCKRNEEIARREREQRKENIMYLTSKRLCVLCERTNNKCPGFQIHSSKPSICRECGHSSTHHSIIVDENVKNTDDKKAGDIVMKGNVSCLVARE